MAVVIGLVTDSNAWKRAVVVLQQLRDVETKLPAVVFNTTALANYAVAAMRALEATVVSLEPEMPLHKPMLTPLSRSHGKAPAWRKLALWAQLTYSKIIYLDIDVLVMKNIDHMASFPADAFTPEVCAWPKCEAERIPAGINVGVMIVGPDQWKFDALKAYALLTSSRLEEAKDAEKLKGLGTRYLGSAEQSFIREFYEDVMNASLGDPVAARRGWDWGVQSYTDVGACRRIERRDPTRAHGCVPGTTHVMSRRYNARPLDCARCPASIDNIIVHYACSIKPWERKRSHWRTMAWCHGSRNRTNDVLCEPCIGILTEGWFSAEDRMCATLRTAAESSPDVAQAFKSRC